MSATPVASSLTQLFAPPADAPGSAAKSAGADLGNSTSHSGGSDDGNASPFETVLATAMVAKSPAPQTQAPAPKPEGTQEVVPDTKTKSTEDTAAAAPDSSSTAQVPPESAAYHAQSLKALLTNLHRTKAYAGQAFSGKHAGQIAPNAAAEQAAQQNRAVEITATTATPAVAPAGATQVHGPAATTDSKDADSTDATNAIAASALPLVADPTAASTFLVAATLQQASPAPVATPASTASDAEDKSAATSTPITHATVPSISPDQLRQAYSQLSEDAHTPADSHTAPDAIDLAHFSVPADSEHFALAAVPGENAAAPQLPVPANVTNFQATPQATPREAATTLPPSANVLHAEILNATAQDLAPANAPRTPQAAAQAPVALVAAPKNTQAPRAEAAPIFTALPTSRTNGPRAAERSTQTLNAASAKQPATFTQIDANAPRNAADQNNAGEKVLPAAAQDEQAETSAARNSLPERSTEPTSTSTRMDDVAAGIFANNSAAQTNFKADAPHAAASTPQVQQVASAIQDGVAKGKQTLEIELKPEGLGTVTVKLTAERNAAGELSPMRVEIQTSSGAAHSLLSKHLDELRDVLGRADVQVAPAPKANLEAPAAPRSENPSQGGTGGQGRQERAPREDRQKQEPDPNAAAFGEWLESAS